jgi:hypothetical protein
MPLHPDMTPFQPGNTLSVGHGRPRGRRTSYLHTKAFREALGKAWSLYGEAALKIFAREDPGGFCKLFAYLEPRGLDVDITHTAVAALDDSDLERMILEFRQRLGPPKEEPLTIEHIRVPENA